MGIREFALLRVGHHSCEQDYPSQRSLPKSSPDQFSCLPGSILPRLNLPSMEAG